MTALKYTRNAMAKRIVDTAERFIENNLGDDGSNMEIMEHLISATSAGRGRVPESFTTCMDLFGSFCTKKELNSTLHLKTQMNLAGKDYNEAVKKVQKELEGNLLQDKISSARMAFIYLQIMNNIRVITDPEDQDTTMKVTYEFRPKPAFLRFTSSLERNQTGGWNKSGMALYMKMIERETTERKKMALDFARDLRTTRCETSIL
eukprot:scaffold28992_cov55-Attheya_sp.AAC.2